MVHALLQPGERAATNGIALEVKIVGHSAESVQAARAAVEYIKEFYPVEESMVGWMLGKQRKNLVTAASRPRSGHERRDGICCDLAPSKLNVQ